MLKRMAAGLFSILLTQALATQSPSPSLMPYNHQTLPAPTIF